jgi:hypothetical protein
VRDEALQAYFDQMGNLISALAGTTDSADSTPVDFLDPKSVFQNRFAGNRHGNGEPQIVLSVGRVARVASTTRGAPDRF